MKDFITIEHIGTGESRSLEVIDGDPKAKTIILRWPMCGDLVFSVENGKARSLRHNMWRLTDESKSRAAEYLRVRREITQRMIETSGRST